VLAVTSDGVDEFDDDTLRATTIQVMEARP